MQTYLHQIQYVVYIWMCVSICIYVWVCLYAYMYECVRIYVCMYYLYAMYAWECVCLHICVSLLWLLANEYHCHTSNIITFPIFCGKNMPCYVGNITLLEQSGKCWWQKGQPDIENLLQWIRYNSSRHGNVGIKSMMMKTITITHKWGCPCRKYLDFDISCKYLYSCDSPTIESMEHSVCSLSSNSKVLSNHALPF